jgi:hypothetical protein
LQSSNASRGSHFRSSPVVMVDNTGPSPCESVLAMKNVLVPVQFLIGASSIGVFYYYLNRFSTYSIAGTNLPDSMHGIVVNNHGSYTYITAEQSGHLHALLVLAIALFAVAVSIELIRRRFLKH